MPADTDPLPTVPPQLAEGFVKRMHDIANDVDFPIRLSVDETEAVIQSIWEIVGHMSSDVGTHGYEYNLIQRLRENALMLQTAMLAAIAHVAPQILSLVEHRHDEEREDRAGGPSQRS